MNKRIMSIVIVLVLMLSMVTTAFAATETYFVESMSNVDLSVKLTIPNITAYERVKLSEKEMLEYVDSAEDLDEMGVWIDDFAGVYDSFIAGDKVYSNDYLKVSLRTSIAYENSRGGVPVYYVDKGPVVITSENVLGALNFTWKGDAKTDYTPKYYDTSEFYEKFYDNEMNSIKVYNEQPENWKHAPGTTAGLSEPGKYLFRVSDADSTVAGVFAVHIGGTTPATPAQPKPAQPKPNATPTAAAVLVNKAPINFEAYTIEGNNYFKLRDLAQVVNNTEKNFEVEWDGAKNAINLKSNTPYTPAGGELAKGDNTPKNAVPTTSRIFRDGVELPLTAYTIGGNNFFKLRDIAEAFNIGVTWDNATKTIGIDTSIGYTE